MINELQVFSYEGSEIRTVQLGGEPWWVLKDICDVLELSNPSVIADRLDEDEKAKVEPKQYLGSRSNEPATVISESGLYNVILLSRKPEAKKFKRWITHEVLPTIRKHRTILLRRRQATQSRSLLARMSASPRTRRTRRSRLRQTPLRGLP